MTMESEAVKRISKLSIRYDHSWGVLREFIKVSEIGLNTAIPQIYEQKHGYAKELIYNPNFKPFVLQSEIQAQYTPEDWGEFLHPGLWLMPVVQHKLRR
jgi:hypothetical protein